MKSNNYNINNNKYKLLNNNNNHHQEEEEELIEYILDNSIGIKIEEEEEYQTKMKNNDESIYILKNKSSYQTLDSINLINNDDNLIITNQLNNTNNNNNLNNNLLNSFNNQLNNTNEIPLYDNIKINYKNCEIYNSNSLTSSTYDNRNIFIKIKDFLLQKNKHYSRSIYLPNGLTYPKHQKYPKNEIKNRRYNLFTFLPLVLFEQFKFFFNLYFLLVALSQIIPQLQVGFLFTYVAPLVFVLSVTLLKELYDDLKRYKRDLESNSQLYNILNNLNEINLNNLNENNLNNLNELFIKKPSSNIQVGDIIQIECNQRIPADCILLKTSEKSGASFIRTDQLDGETDQKLRHAIPTTQKLHLNQLRKIIANLYIEKPKKDIYDFLGNFTCYDIDGNVKIVESLSLENTLWANTVVATGTIIALVIYTGRETRSSLNASQPRSKVGKLDQELNTISKFLFILMVIISIFMVALKQFQGLWYITIFRFILLFSSIIPISLRVNLDMGKTVYSFFIMKDKKIPGTIVRNSSLPEDLGRINYLFTDKTGTLTQNVMLFKKLHLGNISYNEDGFEQVKEHVTNCYKNNSNTNDHQIKDFIKALALCHNVTPIIQSNMNDSIDNNLDNLDISNNSNNNDINSNNYNIKIEREYQGSSPDEIALVKFSEECGLILENRTLTQMTLRNPNNEFENYEILNIFPFTSASKRMGIIIKKINNININNNSNNSNNNNINSNNNSNNSNNSNNNSNSNNNNEEIIYYCKGADSIMKKLIKTNQLEWLDEEADNMAREGLRTLVFGYKKLSNEEYLKFSNEYKKACSLINDRMLEIDKIKNKYLDSGDLNIIGISGVEDLLQENVQQSLEQLRNAGIKIWMLTGDKVETAICISRSTKLVSRNQNIFQIISLDKNIINNLLDEFNNLSNNLNSNNFNNFNNNFNNNSNNLNNTINCGLIIDGDTLEIALSKYESKFISIACKATSVICCRCSPTQKALVVSLVKKYTKKQTAAIGDGGNDVSMILNANVGIGIVGKEGKHASLAADFSINQFSYCTDLILWHGRNSYKRSAALSQFIIHRGLIISVIQAIFSSMFYFSTIAIFTGWLLVGYATYYTNFSVFSLILDEDVKRSTVYLFPELYKELQKGRVLSFKTFLIWCLKATYQGGIIMILAIFLFENNFLRIQTISFTALILTEIVMVSIEVHRKFNPLIILSEILSISIYIGSMFLLPSYFDLPFIMTFDFWWKSLVITLASTSVVAIFKIIYSRINPPVWSKLN